MRAFNTIQSETDGKLPINIPSSGDRLYFVCEELRLFQGSEIIEVFETDEGVWILEKIVPEVNLPTLLHRFRKIAEVKEQELEEIPAKLQALNSLYMRSAFPNGGTIVGPAYEIDSEEVLTAQRNSELRVYDERGYERTNRMIEELNKDVVHAAADRVQSDFWTEYRKKYPLR